MPASDRTEIIQTGPLIAHAADQLKQHFTVHELWKAADRAGLLREVADRVRGVAAGQPGREPFYPES